jgi:hypothetical protein
MSEGNRPHTKPAFDWALWVKWILATTLGWALGWIVSEFAVGLTVGLAQWFVLRGQLERPGWWILASAVGWAAGRGLAGAVIPTGNPVLIGGTVGAILGITQWLVLRTQAFQSWWWIVLSAASWGLALTGFLGAPLVGAIAGASTGLGLEPLLRYSSREQRDKAA